MAKENINKPSQTPEKKLEFGKKPENPIATGMGTMDTMYKKEAEEIKKMRDVVEKTCETYKKRTGRELPWEKVSDKTADQMETWVKAGYFIFDGYDPASRKIALKNEKDESKFIPLIFVGEKQNEEKVDTPENQPVVEKPADPKKNLEDVLTRLEGIPSRDLSDSNIDELARAASFALMDSGDVESTFAKISANFGLPVVDDGSATFQAKKRDMEEFNGRISSSMARMPEYQGYLKRNHPSGHGTESDFFH